MDKFNNRLTYSGQLDFKRWALQKLGTKKDLFYFDYITGVDGKTNRDIPGLIATPSMTWGEALSILKKHFKMILKKHFKMQFPHPRLFDMMFS